MILELDVGNSRIKWRLLTAETLAPVSEGHVAGFADLQQIAELKASLSFARMCSVRQGEVNQQIENWIRSDYGIGLERALVSSSCGGVTNRYADVSRLGIDRWLAMLAAYRKANGACMVIDSGTAFTVDVVDAQGLHLGGYIIPGLGLMRASLEANTAIRLTADYSTCSQQLGHSTDEAVFNGTVSALLATIRQLILTVPGKGGIKIYFAGGDAQLLHDLAGIEGSEIARSLVLDGLDVACPRPALQDERQ
ncbi:MAG: type III pantothenate kinase [Pseudohongiellaceae bacterium]